MRSAQKSAAPRTPYLFLIPLLYGTFAFGATTPTTRAVCDVLLVIVIVGYFLEIRIRRLRNRVPTGILLVVGSICLIGGISLVNPTYRYDARLDFLEPLTSGLSWLPTTYDWATSLPLILHGAVLAGVLLFLVGAVADRKFRWSMIGAIAVIGFVIAVIGVFQKVTDARSLLFSSIEYDGNTFFGSFRYHGNAAAFLNLCWPASLAMLLREVRKSGSNIFAISLWANALLFTLGATLVNTSKYGQAILIPSLIIAALAFRRGFPKFEGGIRRTIPVIAIIVAALFLVLALFSAETVSMKWAEALSTGSSLKGRLLAYETAIEMVKNAPLWGHGAGTFGLLFPYFSIGFGDSLGGKWTYAHNDYLQTLVEWGIIGSLLIFGLFAKAVFNLAKRQLSHREISLSATASFVGLVLVAIHALVDFPLQIPALQLIVLFYLAIGLSESHRHFRRKRSLVNK